MDLIKFIEPTKLDNTDDNQRHGDGEFVTKDLVFLRSMLDVKEMLEEERIIYPTDYAIMNGAMMSSGRCGKEKRKSCWTWLRSAYSPSNVRAINLDGYLYNEAIVYTFGGVCPALHLNLTSIISARSASQDILVTYKIARKTYHGIHFGEQPKTYVGNKLNARFEKYYQTGKLNPTGKAYTGYMDDNGDIIYHPEYEFEGDKYVRVKTKRMDNDSEFLDGTMAPESGTYCWAKVEPILWKINNWKDLPKALNPQGNGTAQYIDVVSQEAILSGIPFYPNYNDENCSMWQNSTVRGYLNGINVNNIKINGNTEYTTPNGGDFTGKNNFLYEAFNITLVKDVHDDLDINEVPEKYRKAYALGAGMIAEQELKQSANNLFAQAIANHNSLKVVANKPSLPKVRLPKQAIIDVNDQQILKNVVKDVLLIADLDESFVRQYKKELTKIILENSTVNIDQKLVLLEVINNSNNFTR